jgi:thiol-disulfide isomerase/thioredoxin
VKWLVLGVAACGAAAPPVPDKLVQVNAPGAMVDLMAQAVDGYVTVVDFWAESCAACATVGAMLETAVAGEPRVVVRKIDVGDGFTAVAKAYQISALPHYKIYDRYRRLRYDLVGNDCVKAGDYAKRLVAEP